MRKIFLRYIGMAACAVPAANRTHADRPSTPYPILFATQVPLHTDVRARLSAFADYPGGNQRSGAAGLAGEARAGAGRYARPDAPRSGKLAATVQLAIYRRRAHRADNGARRKGLRYRVFPVFSGLDPALARQSYENATQLFFRSAPCKPALLATAPTWPIRPGWRPRATRRRRCANC